MGTEKISAAQALQVYEEIPRVLRALTTERDTALSKLAEANKKIAEYERQDRIEKIARSMENKNLDVGTSIEEKIERIEKSAAAGRSLDVIEEAVNMSAPQKSLGGLGGELEPGNGESQLTTYLLGQIE